MSDWKEQEKQRAAEQAKYLNWLRELQAGDQFAIAGTGMNRGYALLTVSRITPTQIVVDLGNYERRFDRKTGQEKGERKYDHMLPMTQDIRDAIELLGLRAWIEYRLPKSISLETLRAMKKAFDENHKESTGTGS